MKVICYNFYKSITAQSIGVTRYGNISVINNYFDESVESQGIMGTTYVRIACVTLSRTSVWLRDDLALLWGRS